MVVGIDVTAIVPNTVVTYNSDEDGLVDIWFVATVCVVIELDVIIK